jgi:hypothetical protein
MMRPFRYDQNFPKIRDIGMARPLRCRRLIMALIVGQQVLAGN